MTTDRKTMDAALKETVVPVLRQLGFKGSFPHFYRDQNRHIDLLTFQFNTGGGSFVIEISYADPSRENIYIYKDTPPSKLRSSQASERLRLGTKPEEGNLDHWFSFEPKGIFRRVPSPEQLAESVIPYITGQAQQWWDAEREARKTANKTFRRTK